jgi:hypothetical protein
MNNFWVYRSQKDGTGPSERRTGPKNLNFLGLVPKNEEFDSDAVGGPRPVSTHSGELGHSFPLTPAIFFAGLTATLHTLCSPPGVKE